LNEAYMTLWMRLSRSSKAIWWQIDQRTGRPSELYWLAWVIHSVLLKQVPNINGFGCFSEHSRRELWTRRTLWINYWPNPRLERFYEHVTPSWLDDETLYVRLSMHFIQNCSPSRCNPLLKLSNLQPTPMKRKL
jgi:hypothetical protein